MGGAGQGVWGWKCGKDLGEGRRFWRRRWGWGRAGWCPWGAGLEWSRAELIGMELWAQGTHGGWACPAPWRTPDCALEPLPWALHSRDLVRVKVTAITFELQTVPQGQGSRETGPLGRVPHLWAESPGQLPPSHPVGCWPSAEQQSIRFCFVLFFSLSFLQMRRKILTVSLLPLDLRCLRERQLRLQKLFLNSCSHLGAQPTQGSHLTLLLTTALPTVSLASQVPDQSKCSFPLSPLLVAELRPHGLGPVLGPRLRACLDPLVSSPPVVHHRFCATTRLGPCQPSI